MTGGEVFAWAFAGGLVGAALMDVAEAQAARFGLRSGVTVALVGRWVIHLARGRIRHADILATPGHPREVEAGWVFHFLVGGGGVALLYPAVFLALGLPLPGNALVGGLLFGLATSLLPWFVLLPAFGWGVFGRRAPPGSNALLASTLSHMPYGLAVGVLLELGRRA